MIGRYVSAVQTCTSNEILWINFLKMLLDDKYFLIF